MSEQNEQRSAARFPLDLATLLGPFFILLPSLLLSGALTTALYHTPRGDDTLLWIAAVLGFIGVVLLFFARLPLYRQRRFFTFGPRALDSRHRRLYAWAYFFVGAS